MAVSAGKAMLCARTDRGTCVSIATFVKRIVLCRSASAEAPCGSNAVSGIL